MMDTSQPEMHEIKTDDSVRNNSQQNQVKDPVVNGIHHKEPLQLVAGSQRLQLFHSENGLKQDEIDIVPSYTSLLEERGELQPQSAVQKQSQHRKQQQGLSHKLQYCQEGENENQEEQLHQRPDLLQLKSSELQSQTLDHEQLQDEDEQESSQELLGDSQTKSVEPMEQEMNNNCIQQQSSSEQDQDEEDEESQALFSGLFENENQIGDSQISKQETAHQRSEVCGEPQSSQDTCQHVCETIDQVQLLPSLNRGRNILVDQEIIETVKQRDKQLPEGQLSPDITQERNHLVDHIPPLQETAPATNQSEGKLPIEQGDHNCEKQLFAAGECQIQFDEKDHCSLRLRKMNDKVSCKVMLIILVWGTRNLRRSDMSFEVFFLEEKKLTNGAYRGIFNRIQREKLAKDLSGASFDVTLLFSCIKFGCDKVDPPNSAKWIDPGDNLERSLSSAKVFRNDLMHEEGRMPMDIFLKKAESLREALEKAIRHAGEKYSIDPSLIEKHVSEMNEVITAIRDQPVAVIDIENYRHMTLYADLLNLLLTTGKDEISEVYMKFSDFNPVSFITGREFHLNIGVIFTRIEILNDHKGQGDKEEDCKSIEYEDMLVHGGKSHQGLSKIKIVEGPAGSGKSTLTRKMMRDWVEGETAMIDLTSFDLMLYMECRDSTNSSFIHLVTSLMPKTARKFREGDLMKLVLGLKLLIVVDGLDEMNKSSTQLFQELLNLKQKYDIFLFCTSRPEKIEDCYRMIPSGEETTHMRIVGISDSRREEFASRYHDEMRRLGQSQQETRGLMDYLRRSGSHLKEQWRLPLNLVLLTVLWADAPERVNCVTTATELYFELHRLTVDKLLVRLMCKEQTQCMGVRNLQYKVEQFVIRLCYEALHGLKNDEIFLSDASITSLSRVCDTAGIPEEESFGVFLARKIMWSRKGMLYKVSFPHKGMQDFMGALYMLLRIKQKGCDLDIKGLIKSDLSALFSEMKLGNVSERNRVGEGQPSITRGLSTKLRKSVSGTTNALQRACHKVTKRCSHVVSVMRQTRRLPTGRSPKLQRMRRYISEPVLNLWNTYVHHSAIFTDILNELYPADNEKIQYHKFNNTFVHLTGLLHLTSRSNMSKGFADELVNIMQKTGIKRREEWLNLISNVKCDEIVAEVITRRIPSVTQEGTIVKDATVYSYVSIFQKKCPKKVSVEITAKPIDIPRLEELLLLLSDKDCQVQNLELHDEFQYPAHVTNGLEWALQKIFQDCMVENYRGVMGCRLGSFLPKSIERLRIGISNPEQYANLLDVLNSTHSSLSTLKRLVIHLSSGIDFTKLTPLPSGLNVHLYLSDMDSSTVEWARETALKLQPPLHTRGFVSMLFPRCKLDVSDFEELIRDFSKFGVRISAAICTSASVPFTQEQGLQNLAQKLLEVDFRLIPDCDLWTKW